MEGACLAEMASRFGTLRKTQLHHGSLGNGNMPSTCAIWQKECFELEPEENGQVPKDTFPELRSSDRPHPLLRNDCRGSPWRESLKAVTTVSQPQGGVHARLDPSVPRACTPAAPAPLPWSCCSLQIRCSSAETCPEPQGTSAPLSARLHAVMNSLLLFVQPDLQDPSSET